MSVTCGFCKGTKVEPGQTDCVWCDNSGIEGGIRHTLAPAEEAKEAEFCRAHWLADRSTDRPAYPDYLKGWLACAKSRSST